MTTTTQFTGAFFDEDITTEDHVDGLEILDVNWQTTAAVGLTVASGGVLGALSLAAFPAQTIALAGGIGTLAYTGKRRADGQSAFPFMDKQSTEDKSSKKTTTKSTDKPSAKADEKSVEETEETSEV